MNLMVLLLPVFVECIVNSRDVYRSRMQQCTTCLSLKLRLWRSLSLREDGRPTPVSSSGPTTSQLNMKMIWSVTLKHLGVHVDMFCVLLDGSGN